jgi:hypothetical protein
MTKSKIGMKKEVLEARRLGYITLSSIADLGSPFSLDTKETNLEE